MPPIACNWTIYHDSIAKNWDVPYVKAIQKFKEIISNDVATKEVIDVDKAFFFFFCQMYLVLCACILF
ncbi:hypothetical protein RHMOL_Rhmol09G0104900 [Rhododendron molle]|uniref:Uncharacterized protein n=1 Tax=Rhododendron molle TaxID=49168 RepID=A0ACC0MD76_RHOML|nr:hypothetical protein RHMOL_Rhmol09G0104900 [Rhododendron molle]